jgi:hypothetical protein
LHFDLINRVHVPIALGSMLFAFLLLAIALARGRFDPLARLAATVTIALLANAVVCGALSGPHDRYGARIVWIATLTAAIAVLHALKSQAAERDRRTGNAVAPQAPLRVSLCGHGRRQVGRRDEHAEALAQMITV